ncbi:MAG TPA: hypothetical protein VNJ04_12665 [Gemmatimonadaceae bacterium]|nr:hypothetical protein [Gemmatimonadaceae bacterium]
MNATLSAVLGKFSEGHENVVTGTCGGSRRARSSRRGQRLMETLAALVRRTALSEWVSHRAQR